MTTEPTPLTDEELDELLSWGSGDPTHVMRAVAELRRTRERLRGLPDGMTGKEACEVVERTTREAGEAIGKLDHAEVRAIRAERRADFLNDLLNEALTKTQTGTLAEIADLLVGGLPSARRETRAASAGVLSELRAARLDPDALQRALDREDYSPQEIMRLAIAVDRLLATPADVEPERPAAAHPDGSTVAEVARYVLTCANGHEPDARIVGNCRAADLDRVCRAALAAPSGAGVPPTPIRDDAGHVLTPEQVAVGAFIDFHAARLANTAGNGSWAHLNGEERSEWASEVHHVLNNLTADDNGTVHDARPEVTRRDPVVPRVVTVEQVERWAFEIADARDLCRVLRDLGITVADKEQP